MAQTDRPEALLDAAQIIFQPADDVEAPVDVFLQRWKGWTLDVFARVLQQTDETDHDELVQTEKLFALSALGFLAYPEAPTLLFPFIRSPKRTERWVSILSLGLLREPAAFPLLQQMLLEDLLNPRAFDRDSFYDCTWYMVLRNMIALVLGEWGNPLAISPLCEAMRQCWAFETNPNVYFGKPTNSFEDYEYWLKDYDRFIDRLAFALGKLGAQEALETISLLPFHWLRVQMYFIFGTLSGSDPIDYLIFIRPPIREHVDGTFETTYSTIPRVMKALETHFHLSQEEQISILHQFVFESQRRFEEVYPRNIPGFEEHFPYFDDEPF